MSDMGREKGEKLQDLILPISTAMSAPPSPINPTYKKPNAVRKELTVFLGEFIGTFMFLFIAFVGTQVALNSATINPFVPEGENPAPETPKLIYIAFSFGAGLAINVAIFADVSGGMFNPAVCVLLVHMFSRS
jgi:aquaporin related protein